MDPAEMKSTMTDLYRGCMRGRTMYVIPFVMGHLEADKPMFGVEVTDSAYVVASMRVMARMGTKVLRRMEELDAAGQDVRWVPGLHSVGAPLEPGQQDVPWPCNDTKYIVRPRMQPRYSSVMIDFISPGSIQLLVGPASASSAEQM
jgi:phosphoenolpyruvate carboxykinase (GTP)